MQPAPDSRDLAQLCRTRPCCQAMGLLVPSASSISVFKLPALMKNTLARFLLAFMLLWLPLQAYAAQTMPFCQNHHGHATALAEAPQHEGCHGQQGHNASSISKISLACDDCSSCHAIYQPALLFSPILLGIDAVRAQQPLLAASFSLFFPEQPQRPPLAIFS